jgi:hypothetical protein
MFMNFHNAEFRIQLSLTDWTVNKLPISRSHFLILHSVQKSYQRTCILSVILSAYEVLGPVTDEGNVAPNMFALPQCSYSWWYVTEGLQKYRRLQYYENYKI